MFQISWYQQTCQSKCHQGVLGSGCDRVHLVCELSHHVSDDLVEYGDHRQPSNPLSDALVEYLVITDNL